MNIKKVSENLISLENTADGVKVLCRVENEGVIVEVKGESEIIIDKPGDYEYFKATVTAFEVPEEKYLGKINLVRIILDDVRVLFSIASKDADKDILSNLANIDIFLTHYQGSSKLKESISDFDPKTLVILNKFVGSEDYDLEGLKKDLGTTNIEEISSLKVKSTDFPDSDEFTLASYILK